jgi:hypothetical protein
MRYGYSYSQEIDSHHAAEHGSTDQSRNGCRMCYFCHAQLSEITQAKNIKSPIWQHSCQSAKVVEAFCDAACRLSNQCRPSIHQSPVDKLRVPTEIPITLSWAPLRGHMRWHRVHHRDRRQHTIPIALATLPGAILPATSFLGGFRTPATVHMARSFMAGIRNPAQSTWHVHSWPASETLHRAQNQKNST